MDSYPVYRWKQNWQIIHIFTTVFKTSPQLWLIPWNCCSVQFSGLRPPSPPPGQILPQNNIIQLRLASIKAEEKGCRRNFGMALLDWFHDFTLYKKQSWPYHRCHKRLHLFHDHNHNIQADCNRFRQQIKLMHKESFKLLNLCNM